MLGPNCVLVRRTAMEYQSASQAEAAAAQLIAFGRQRRWDWLFDQCCHIAQALNDNDIALAQIFGVHAAPDDLDDQQVAKLADAAPLLKENFDPDEPRVPAGNPDGGQWTTDDGDSAEGDRKSVCIERCAYLLERPLTVSVEQREYVCVLPMRQRLHE